MEQTLSIDRANVCYFNYYTTQHLLDNFYQFSSSSCLINLLVENRIYKGKFAITYPLQTSKFFTNKTLLCTMLSIFILIFLFIYFFNKGISYGLERKMRKIRKIVINVSEALININGTRVNLLFRFATNNSRDVALFYRKRPLALHIDGCEAIRRDHHPICTI